MSTTSNFAEFSAKAATGMDWEPIYASELPRVFNFFRYLTGNDPVAEDLTADTFRKAWQNRHKYDHNRGAFSTWLFTIARRTSVDYFRSRKTVFSLESASTIVDGTSPEQTYDKEDEILRLSLILSQFPEREREIIALKYGASCSNKEIAQQMRLSETNVSTLLHRVIQKLREAWEVEE